MICLIGMPWCLQGQEPVPVARPIAPLDPHDPVRFPSLDPIRPYFEWAMKERFGFDKKTIFGPGSSSDVPDGIIDYDFSLCYLDPESYLSGADCPKYPWVATLNAMGTSGRNLPLSFDWIIPGDVQCNSATAGRIDHTATLLQSAKVLIVGGRSTNNAPLPTADLYDPAAGTFFPTGSMTVGRVGHTATLLRSGKVLIAGGAAIGPGGELYDPATGTFRSTTGYMSSRRANHAAALLPNGKVLIAGGSYSGQKFSTAELFDPVTGNFTPTGNMTAARENHVATLLNDGRVLITGGGGYGAGFAELYDPVTGTFSPTSAGIGTLLTFHTATLLLNGKVLIAGGAAASSSYQTTAELYDPATNTFSATTGRMTARVGHTATRLQNDQVLIAGGLSGTTTLSTAELYDPATNTFRPTTGSMSPERKYHTATLLPNGVVLIAGGVSGTSYTPNAALYDPTPSTFGPPKMKNIALSVPDSGPFPDSPIISCAFAKQDTYPVTLRVKDAVGNIRPMTRDVTLKDLFIVSIGDSLASGQGNPDRPKVFVACLSDSDCKSKLRNHGASEWQIDSRSCGNVFGSKLCMVPAQWQDQRFYRSFNAGPALAAWSLERIDPHTSVTFLHLARSGATISQAQGQLADVTELLCPKQRDRGRCFDSSTNERVPVRHIDALLLNVGADDIGFGSLVKGCAALEGCQHRVVDDRYPDSEINYWIRDIQNVGARLAELPQKYAQLNNYITQNFSVSKTYITEYFDPTRDEHGNFCSPALPNTKEYARKAAGDAWLLIDITDALYSKLDYDGLTRGELEWAYPKVIVPLNEAVREAARANNWVHISGLQEAFKYHGVCAGSDKWVVGLRASYDTQGDLEGTMHPNFFGQTAYQIALLDAVTKNSAELAPVQARIAKFDLKNLVAQPTVGFRGLLVGTANQPPKANAGPDQTVRLASLVTLNGNGSSDPDSGPGALSFSWAQMGGPVATPTAISASTPTITFAPRVEGSYVFSLVVNDGQDNSDPNSVTIKVPLLGDIDLDGDVDKNDLKLVRAARNKPAKGPNDLRDLDGDGKIDASDEQMLMTLCTRRKCASN